jgi:hypothetical protein
MFYQVVIHSRSNLTGVGTVQGFRRNPVVMRSLRHGKTGVVEYRYMKGSSGLSQVSDSVLRSTGTRSSCPYLSS